MSITFEQATKFATYMSDVGRLNRAVDWISQNLKPGEVFTHDQLSEWAKDHGYVEKETNDLDLL